MNQLLKLGTEYGGWVFPEVMKLDGDSIIYSAGVGEDMSFDLKLEDKYKSKIFLIDPTERAIKHYNEVQEFYKNKSFKFTGDIQDDYLSHIDNLNPDFNNFTYINMGLYKEKTKLKFYKQDNSRYVSQSLVPGMFGKNYDEVDVDSIKNIMKGHKHNKIDLLKLDIEGAEVKVLNSMVESEIFPRYLAVEFDLFLHGKDSENNTQYIMQKLLKKYNIIHSSSANITFQLR